MLEAADFYELEKPGLGSTFLDEVHRALRQAMEHPAAAPVALGNVRRRVVAKFPYSVMYSAGEVGIVVSAVAHHRQRPLYWRDRV